MLYQAADEMEMQEQLARLSAKLEHTIAEGGPGARMLELEEALTTLDKPMLHPEFDPDLIQIMDFHSA